MASPHPHALIAAFTHSAYPPADSSLQQSLHALRSGFSAHGTMPPVPVVAEWVVDVVAVVALVADPAVAIADPPCPRGSPVSAVSVSEAEQAATAPTTAPKESAKSFITPSRKPYCIYLSALRRFTSVD